MAKRASYRKRCRVCRKWFTPLPRLAQQQCVCSEACRKLWRRKLSLRRRGLDPARYREEERERKRRSRAAARPNQQADSGSKNTACHAPGSNDNPPKSRREFDRIWDKVKDMSRTGWERETRRIAQKVYRQLRQTTTSCEGSHAPGKSCDLPESRGILPDY